MSIDQRSNHNSWCLAIGGLVGAIMASSCCIIPLALFFLGISGAWISNLTALEPYQPLFVVIALAFLGSGFWMVYFKPKKQCADGSYCAKPGSGKLLKILLWASVVLIAVALLFPYLVPLFFY